MTNNARRILAICLVSAAVSACGGGNDAAPAPPVVVTPPAARIEDGFGTGFGTVYRADPNTDARDPAAGDINPVDPTKDPTTI